MTQYGTVTKIIDASTALVTVERGTACGGNCGSCGTCAFKNKLTVTAKNLPSAAPGESVTIESSTADFMGAAALVYILPLIMLFLGYGLSAALGLPDGCAALVSVGFLLLGVLAAVVTGRRRKTPVTFSIIAIRRD